MKKFVYALPNFLQPKQDKFGMVMYISENGIIWNTYFETKVIAITTVSSVKE